MRSLTRLLALAATTIVTAGAMSSASATLLSFTLSGTGGSYTVNTGNITLATTLKTLPPIETVGACAPVAACGFALLIPGVTLATFSPGLTLHTTLGPDIFSIMVGGLTLSFTTVSAVAIQATGVSTQGFINEQIDGVVTGDASGKFLGQSVSLSEGCTQVNTASLINCSETFQTPGIQRQAPEPISVALLGIGLAGLGFARRRKS